MENYSVSKPIEISKELENINFNQLLIQFPELKTSVKRNSKIARRKNIKKWLFRKRVFPVKTKTDSVPESQLTAFQGAMKLLLIIGQCLGLNCIEGVLVADVTKMRFSVFNWRVLYCTTIGSVQAIETILTVYWISNTSLTVKALGYLAFYLTTCVTTFLYIHLSTRWPQLMQQLANSPLNEYIDKSLKIKCYITCVVIFILALVEHALSIVSKVTSVRDCLSDVDGYDEFHKQSFTWYYELGFPDNKIIMAFIQVINIISTLTWNYSDVYIACISLYLVSILEQINKKIISASEELFLPATFWRSLREDYCKATRLVRAFDDVIEGIVFTSFASNLFFICLQLYNILGNGLKASGSFDLTNVYQNVTTTSNCLNGKYVGNVYVFYVGFSALFILARSLIVSLTAACVHSASLVPAPALYNVPSSSFCPEIARFLDQVHANNVAISGLKFFYVTRELVLSVAGTIVTYELVMLQVTAVKTE